MLEYNSTNVTLPSGASRGNSVQVQLLLSAPKFAHLCKLLFYYSVLAQLDRASFSQRDSNILDMGWEYRRAGEIKIFNEEAKNVKKDGEGWTFYDEENN